MIPRLILGIIAALGLASCATQEYRLASRQGEEMPCYSTWNYLPHNS